MPARVPAQAKELILELVDDAVRGGVSHRWACSVLGVSDDRAHRWRRRLRDAGSLEDRRPGGVALHALRPSETAEILAVCEQWGPVDRSYRKLAHRGSYEGRVWVSASTLRRVLAAQGLILPKPPARDPAPWVRWPHWLVWEPNKIWCWDMTHFPRAKRAAFAIVDVVSRRWIDTLVSIEETSTQVRVLFDRALATEGLTELITPERVELFEQDPTQPILLACSDNGPQMTSQATRELFAALAVAQRLGRPRTPTDQAWIESLFGHVKAENPHLEQIRDPAVLQTELRRARRDYNSVRLHAGIGYVTPDDEHTGRGEQIRQARTEGLRRAHQQRLDYHRRNHHNQPPGTGMSWFIPQPSSAFFSDTGQARSPRRPSPKPRRTAPPPRTPPTPPQSQLTDPAHDTSLHPSHDWPDKHWTTPPPSRSSPPSTTN